MPLTDLPDDELARLAIDGDRTAFACLVDRHAPRLLALAVTLVATRADAEDVVQETLLGAVRGIREFRGQSSIKTWLSRILLRQAVLSRRKKRATLPLPELASAESAVAADSRIDVAAALERLSDEHRQVLVLREWNGLSYDEIAELLEIPRGTVESRLFRARLEMRRGLRSYEP